MNILLTGSGGQVGIEVSRLVSAPDKLIAYSRAMLDITDATAVSAAVQRDRPDVVINAAAYTAVDRAESDAEAAFAVNRDGAANVAQACSDAGIPLVHISTDYVFDGTKGSPYVPEDPASPINVYGRSKAEGEDAVRAALDEHVIVRTAWVFSSHGHNFVRTMARLMQERDEVRVVCDQFGHATWARDVARACLEFARRAVAGDAPWGTVHLAGQPLTTWHGFAEAIRKELGDRSRVQRVEPIPSSAYPTPARRPEWVELDTSALAAVYDSARPDWREALRQVVRELDDKNIGGAGT